MPLPPLVPPGPPLSADELARGARHLLLPGLGVEGQRRLRAARVLVVGAGGLGAPVLQYLAAAGVGVLGVVDDDVVDTSNLQRQVIHGVADVGRPKVDSARDAVAAIDPSVHVRTHHVRLDESTVDAVLAGYDLVVDGTDNFPTRYLVNDACVRLGLPEVWGSVLRFDAQVSVFWGAPPDGVDPVDLRDLFPMPPAPDEVPSCAEAGVLGALCGQVGSLMATEAVKLVTGLGEPLLGRVLVVDALRSRWQEVPLRRRAAAGASDGGSVPTPRGATAPATDGPTSAAPARPGSRPATHTPRPGPEALVERRAGLDVRPVTPGVRPAADAAAPALPAHAITAADLAERLVAGGAYVVDVREPVEAARVAIDGSHLVPLGTVLDGSALADLPRDRELLVVCQVGARSRVAVDVLRAAGFDATNVEGGMMAWLALR